MWYQIFHLHPLFRNFCKETDTDFVSDRSLWEKCVCFVKGTKKQSYIVWLFHYSGMFFIRILHTSTDCYVDVPLLIASGGPSFTTGLLIAGRSLFHSHLSVKIFQSVFYIHTWVRASWIEFSNFPTRCDLSSYYISAGSSTCFGCW